MTLTAGISTGGAAGANRTPRSAGSPWARRRWWTPWAFLLPFLVLFAAFVLAPAALSVGVSFTNWRIVGSPVWVGLRNFRAVFGDPAFRTALRNTAYFVVIAAPVLVALGLALALLVDTRRRGVRLVRSLIYLPVVLNVIIVATLWRWLLDSKFGLVDYYLHSWFGIGAVPWLSSSTLAMPAIMITTVWWTVGTNMVIYLAALQDIPEELYEAAELDGAPAWRRFLHVTVPMLGNVNSFVIPFTVIAGFQIFGQVYLMTGGGPGTSTLVLSQYVYVTAFQNFAMGKAAAASVVMLVIMLGGTLAVLRLAKLKL